MPTSSTTAPSAQPMDWAQLMTNLNNLTPEQKAMLAQIPAIQAPNGVISNLSDPPTIASVQYGITSALLALMLLFVANRIYVKAVLVKKYTWDDLTLLLAVLGTLAYYGAALWGAARGKIGTHLWDVNILQSISSDFLGPSYALIILPQIIFGFLKSSFLILYLQLFRQLQWIRVASMIGLVLNTCAYLGLAIAQIYLATPRKGETLLTHNQTPSARLAVPVSIVGLGIDLTILILPVVAISGLHTTRKKKIGAMLVFLSGLLACICAALSIYYRHRLDALAPNSDITYKILPVNVATLSEMMIGVICACMPALAYTYRNEPAIQSLKNSVSSTFSSASRTAHPWLSGGSGSTISGKRKKPNVYISMDEMNTASSRSTSQAKIIGVRNDYEVHTYDRTDSSEVVEQYRTDVERLHGPLTMRSEKDSSPV